MVFAGGRPPSLRRTSTWWNSPAKRSGRSVRGSGGGFMSGEELQNGIRAFFRRRPFRPFLIELSSGDRLLISHPETIQRYGELFHFEAPDRRHRIFAACMSASCSTCRLSLRNDAGATTSRRLPLLFHIIFPRMTQPEQQRHGVAVAEAASRVTMLGRRGCNISRTPLRYTHGLWRFYLPQVSTDLGLTLGGNATCSLRVLPLRCARTGRHRRGGQ